MGWHGGGRTKSKELPSTLPHRLDPGVAEVFFFALFWRRRPLLSFHAAWGSAVRKRRGRQPWQRCHLALMRYLLLCNTLLNQTLEPTATHRLALRCASPVRLPHA